MLVLRTLVKDLDHRLVQLELAEGYITKIAVDDNNEIIGYKFVHLGKMMEMIAKGMDANEALEKASGQYGRVDDAAKLLDPRHE